ncbi:MAG: MerR family transcriptional regulator [Candidatus Nanopelagicales bacterium]
MLIGEVAEQSGISSRMLRHYDRMGVVSPSQRTSGGYRQYTDDDLRRLFHAEALRSLGLSLREIAAVLDGPGFLPGAVVEQLAEQTRAHIAQQQDLLATLERVQRSDPADWTDVLQTLGLMRGLDQNGASARQRFALSLSDLAGHDGPLLAEAALAETDPGVAGALLWALARAGDATVPLLQAALDSGDTDRRRRAVEALEKINSDRSLGALVAALGHSDPWVERRVALSAGTRGLPEAIPALVALIIAGEDDRDAARVLGILVAEHGYRSEVDHAMGRAVEAGDANQKLRLASALAEIPGRESERLLRALTIDPDRRVELAARYALETIGVAPSSRRKARE